MNAFKKPESFNLLIYVTEKKTFIAFLLVYLSF